MPSAASRELRPDRIEVGPVPIGKRAGPRPLWSAPEKWERMTTTDGATAVDHDVELLEKAADVTAAIREEVGKRIVGQREVVD